MAAQEDGMQRALKNPDNMRGIEEMFATHDARISTLSDRMTAIDNKMDRIQDVLQNIQTSMAASAASQQARSPIGFGMVLSYARDVAILMGLAVSAIIYVVQASTGSETAVMKYRVDEMARAVQHGPLQAGAPQVR